MQTSVTILAAVAALAVAGSAAASGEHVIGQKNKAFTTQKIKAKVGEKLVFKNDDAFAHNIMSLSDAQSFDLGTFGQGQARTVTLAKDGTLEIECAIHPEMKMVVEVTK